MRRKLISLLSVLMLVSVVLLPTSALADGQKVVTLGADLTEEQKTAILKYFGVLGQNVQTIYITNADERAHLGSYVPIEQIGTRTFSCALVNPKSSGGIQVKTANLNWVTSNMIASTLSTSGVANCEVLAASPFPVSGTGALTGIIMAYESAVGTPLDAQKKEIATQELITTGTIADSVGQAQATDIVNDIKIQVIQGQVEDPQQVVQIVNEVADTAEEEKQVYLSDEDRNLLYSLMTQIAEQQYDYDEMKDTLERVEQNVEQIGETVDGIADQQAEDKAAQEQLDDDSILLQTDDSALGDDVVIDATNQEAVSEEPAAQPANQDENKDSDDIGFEIVSGDSYDDGNGQEAAAGQEEPAAPAEEIEPAQEDTIADFFNDGNGEEEPVIPEGTDEFIEEANGEEQPFGEEDEQDIYGGEDEQDIYGEEEQGEEQGEEAGEASFEIGQIALAPDSTFGSTYGAGIGVVRILAADADLIPVSGTLTVTDEFGFEAANIDLADGSKVAAAPLGDRDFQAASSAGFDPQTKILVNTGIQLDPEREYTVTVEGDFALASAPEATAPVSVFAPVRTEAYGVALDLSGAQGASQGASVSGSIIFDENTQASAVITDYNEGLIGFDTTEFTPDAAGFTAFFNGAGATSFTVTFYDFDGNEAGTVNYDVTIF